MSKKLFFSIPMPCHENWDQMTPVEKGRFCNSCQKRVVDFSNMSDRQIAEFFKKPIIGSAKEGAVCGRFMQDQLDRAIEIPKKRIPWVKYFFRFLIPAFLVSARSYAQGKVTTSRSIVAIKDAPSPVKFEEKTAAIQASEVVTVIPNDTIPGDRCSQPTMGIIALPYEDPSFITGIVRDEENNPVPNASIIIKGTRKGVAANDKGFFSLKALKGSPIIILVTAIGFEPVEINLKKERFSDPVTIYLKRKEVIKVQEVVIGTTGLVKRKIVMGAVTRGSKLKKDGMTEKKGLQNPISIFPNPAKKNSLVRIEWRWQEPGDYNLQLLSPGGQVLFSRQIRIVDKSGLNDVQIPGVPAGTYFLQVTNNITKARFAGKLVVQ